MSSSQIYEQLQDLVHQKWLGIYLRFLALVLLFGAIVHVSNIAGLSGVSWQQTPMLWRVMDLLLLGFDLIVAYGLWRKLAWSAIAFTVGIVALQIIPYTLFRTYFILKPEDGNLLNQMVIFELLLLGILGILLSIEK
ncbi:MAG: hypothetical protein QNJ72_03565 [Pleurocapsa sp. MO_226.B13]|nr:hypothetical protein [Pleurocapsa sp. MO_226.B13]